MRPHRLRVTAFGAFAGTEEIRFDELDGLFLLHGETGAGKTTLLDAIAFALYGRVPGVRGKAKRLRSDHAAPGTRTEVILEATVGGRKLRVTRRPEQQRPKRSGAGLSKEPASVILEEDDGAGWEVKSTRIGEADAEILDLMGMSADQFFQVVLLPQGEFARFLHSGADTRAELLQKLFGTDRFRAVEEWLAEHRRQARAEVESATADVDHLLARVSQVADAGVPDPPAPGSWELAWLAGLMSEAEARALDAAAVVAARKAGLDQALAARTDAERLADRQRRRRDALAKRAELEADAEAVAGLRAEAGTAARAALENLRTAGAAELSAAAEEQQERLGRLDALRVVARQADDDEQAAGAARNRAARLVAELAAVETGAAGRRAARPGAVRDRDTASRAASALPSARASADSAARVAADSAALSRERAERQRLQEDHLARRETALALREEAGRLREARVDGMRAELAASLTSGSPCPVCGSLDHPDPVEPAFAPVSREREQEAYAAADDAAGEADRAGRRVAAADATITGLTQRLAKAGATGPDDTVREADAEAARLDAEAARLDAAAATLPARQKVLDDLDQAIAAADRRQAELAEQRSAALTEADAAATRAREARRTLTEQLGAASSLEDALAATRELADTLTTAAAVARVLADPDLDVSLESEAPVAERAEAAEKAQHAHDEALDAHSRAEHTAGQLRQLRPRLAGALEALRPLRERADQVRQLADVAGGLGGNQYKMTLSSFVLAARLEEVAAEASQRLATMTAGRYTLVHTDARRGGGRAGLGLLACDAWTGQDRDTSTLSGGETFLASLALALGLADVVTQESAGTPMEALFVDEGFGTLDEETLEEVLNVLDGLRAGGRVIGIVSHVSELRQRIPSQIHVRKGHHGSHVSVTAG